MSERKDESMSICLKKLAESKGSFISANGPCKTTLL
jgi:hypothetical protein